MTERKKRLSLTLLLLLGVVFFFSPHFVFTGWKGIQEIRHDDTNIRVYGKGKLIVFVEKNDSDGSPHEYYVTGPLLGLKAWGRCDTPQAFFTLYPTGDRTAMKQIEKEVCGKVIKNEELPSDTMGDESELWQEYRHLLMHQLYPM